eukprot:3398668-Amphidinium_carterae.1
MGSRAFLPTNVSGTCVVGMPSDSVQARLLQSCDVATFTQRVVKPGPSSSRLPSLGCSHQSQQSRLLQHRTSCHLQS